MRSIDRQELADKIEAGATDLTDEERKAIVSALRYRRGPRSLKLPPRSEADFEDIATTDAGK